MWSYVTMYHGKETAAFFDGGSRGNGTNGAVAGAGAVFYDKGVKQWEVEEPIAGRATNNVAEYIGFVSVLAAGCCGTPCRRHTAPSSSRATANWSLVR
ncbi:hypothetical protein DIPPA_16578 [Diplonema papillatum]|nr:hypothetical protein DIPPA_16578 [Diplonema papillatum]